MLARTLQGFAFGYTFPAMGAIAAGWSPVDADGVYISILSCFIQLSMIFTMPVAAAFCESDWGWPGVYYVQGAITFATTIAFFVFYRNQARDHCLVNDQEAKLIEAGKCAAKREKVPHKAIFSDLPVWSVVICWFGGSFGFKVLFLYGPTYLNKVLGFSVNSTGLAAALPYVLLSIV
ncbi:Protein F59A1.13, partial [Aphelenchoides avenae]